MSLDLSELLDGPVVTEEIGGIKFRFSEVPISAMLAMQGWIRENCPHPLESIRPHLEGMPPAIATELAENARQEARDWPPKVGTGEGAAVLMGSEAGQVIVLMHGLNVHHPGATLDDAWKVYRAMKRSAAKEIRKSSTGESPTIRRIYAAIFGTLDETEDEPANGVPKGRAADLARSSGNSTSARRNSG